MPGLALPPPPLPAPNLLAVRANEDLSIDIFLYNEDAIAGLQIDFSGASEATSAQALGAALEQVS